MRILYVDHYAGSIRHGMEYRPYYFAREWAERGHEVLIVAASFSHLRHLNPEMTGRTMRETVEGIDYLWVKTVRYRGSGVKRILSMMQFCSRVKRLAPELAASFRPDVVISSSTYPLDHYATRRIADEAGAVLVHELHDLWPLSPMMLGGYGPNHPFIRIMQRAEDDAYRHSDLAISLLPGTREYMEAHGLPPDSWHYVPNGVVEEDWCPEHIERVPEDTAAFLKRLHDEGAFVIGYAGGHSVSNALHLLLDAVADVDRRADEGDPFAAMLQIVLVGKGQEKDALRRKAERMGTKRVHFLDPVNKAAVPDLLRYFDACYLGWTPSSLYAYGTSANKLYDYMMAGKPIVHAYGYPYDPVKAAGCGISVDDAQDTTGIADALIRMAALPDPRREALGARGRDYVLAKHNYRGLSETFLEAMREAVEARRETTRNEVTHASDT